MLAPCKAAARAIREELGDAYAERMLPEEAELLHQTVELKFSPSFPGLVSRYIFYEVLVRFSSLPDGPFQTRESKGNGKHIVHHWEWRDALIQPQAGLVLTTAHIRLLERLFAPLAMRRPLLGAVARVGVDQFATGTPLFNTVFFYSTGRLAHSQSTTGRTAPRNGACVEVVR